MAYPVISVYEDDTVDHVAKLIADQDIGSIVVINTIGKPVGLITERDIVIRVTSKNLIPSKVKAKEIMTSPLRTTEPDKDIKEAAEIMNKHKIRRLIVMQKGIMVGIVSSRDIIAITPALIEIIVERARITRVPLITETSSTAGYCDKCRQWSDTLLNKEGKFICEECQINQLE